MVYLKEIIQKLREQTLKRGNLGTLAYLYISTPEELDSYPANRFAGAEEIAAFGYKGVIIDSEKIDREVQRSPVKGISFADNVFKLIGFQLASNRSLSSYVERKYSNTSLKNKYFISKFEPSFQEKLASELNDESSLGVLMSRLFDIDVPIDRVQDALSEYSLQANDPIDLIVLEDFYKKELATQITKTQYVNKSAKDLIIGALEEFSNGVIKITKDRRKDHQEFSINDEYDVQDLLYLIFKTIFPTLKEEDPTPRVGIKSNRIDLILREEGILIEVKMIKEKDSNEKKFIEELKVDIQSYYECKWLKHLICFVYDPFCKTRDKQNFFDLNGMQTIKDITFSVEVIVAS